MIGYVRNITAEGHGPTWSARRRRGSYIVLTNLFSCISSCFWDIGPRISGTLHWRL